MLERVRQEGEYEECYDLGGGSRGYLNLHLKWIPESITCTCETSTNSAEQTLEQEVE